MSVPAVRAPLFARVFDCVSGQMEWDLGRWREELLAGLTGRVLEIGAGNGANFAHYPDSVADVIAAEPEPYLRRKAQERAASAGVPIRVIDSTAEQLALDDHSVDAAVASLVLCSVADPRRAVRELRRVLKPGGELRFLEHVRAPTPGKARVQQALDRVHVWPWLAGGCHCCRDSVGLLDENGLRVAEVRSFAVGPSWSHTNPHVVGRAT